MSLVDSTGSGLTVAGMPLSRPLQDVRELSRRLVGHFVETVVPCATLPGDALRGDVTIITRTCLELAASMLDGRDLPEKTRRLEVAAAQWAREGIPIDTIHHAIHEGFRVGQDLVMAGASSMYTRKVGPDGALVLTAEDYANLMGGAKLVVDLLDRMTTTVSVAYMRELRAVVSEHHTAVHTLTSALLGGHSTSTMARECGIEIAGSYRVLAVAIPPHPDERNPILDSRVVARRKLRRTQAELASRYPEQALSLLSVDGGTILIPVDVLPDDRLDEFVAHLSRAAHVPITATVIEAAPQQIPIATDQVHALLDMAQRLKLEHGLYRFDDLSLEFQLTRPGPARDHLGTLLDPLDEYPELLQTLQMHISNNLNRQRTARILHVHTNTIDYRLKRIGQLTGFDPCHTTGLWYLRSALVARSYRETN
ncbi:PucR family transcriptional regulator [Nocardia yunnanensis]|uniref:PucR family transcriptional regulator n=1 Tax=Nocardia yunnanensis TaxID=2382165 RepID=A0A386ZNY8_9NOCA|nr:helix-turn-helix domain-containing protein [Nocardia yunnanensis]AYF79148.1 PucR family transcriptional regulator [Nocardia yunnanensis]